MRGHKYSIEEASYIKRLYADGVKEADMKLRFSAEFGHPLSNGCINKYGAGRRYKYKTVKRYLPAVPPSQSTPKPCFCSYCGNRLRG